MRCCSNRSCGTTGSITVGPRSGQAQKAIDAWVEGYNHQRPYQALAMAVPASRFRPRQGGPGKPGLVVAGDVDPAPPTADRGPVELEVLVPASGNLQRGQIQVGGQRFQVGLRHAHKHVTVLVHKDRFEVLDHGQPLKAAARTMPKEVTRFKASEHQHGRTSQGVSSIT